jgi:hypothetical protein
MLVAATTKVTARAGPQSPDACVGSDSRPCDAGTNGGAPAAKAVTAVLTIMASEASIVATARNHPPKCLIEAPLSFRRLPYAAEQTRWSSEAFKEESAGAQGPLKRRNGSTH